MSPSYTTETGLVVIDRRHRSALPPRDNLPNGNPLVDSGLAYSPAISVGPDASEGVGNTQVMTWPPSPPVDVQAWSGWPEGWNTPAWNGWGGWQARLDIIFACIDLNSSILSTMPAYVVRGTEPLPAPSWLANPEPLVYNGWTEFLRSVLYQYQLVGEVFVLCTRWGADGYPLRFMALNPALVTVEMVGGQRRYLIGGEDVSQDILHLRYLTTSPDQPHGVGPLDAAGARVLAVEALTRYTAEMARGGGIPWAVLKYPRRLNQTQMRKLQSDWLEARRSAAGAPAILADGTELTPLSTTPKDMALAEMSQFSEARLAVLLRVPPFLVGLPSGDSMTYSNVTSVFDYHWRSGLRPMANMVMAAMSNWLLPRGVGLELNRDEYVRPGLLERVQAYEGLWRMGAITPPEVRQFERMTTTAAPDDLSQSSDVSHVTQTTSISG